MVCRKSGARVIFLLLFTISYQTATADLVWTPNLQQAYDSILALKLAKGKELLDLERLQRPQNQLVIYVDNLADFVTLMVTENRNEYQVLEKRADARLDLLEAEPASNPWQRYARAEILMHWALLRLKFENSSTSAFFGIRRSYKLLKENQTIYPDFLPGAKTLGMMQVIIGTTPSSYKWLLKLMGFSATVSEGMTNLTRASASQNSHSVEANLFRANAYTFVLKQPEVGISILDSIYRPHTDHVTIGFFLSAALLKAGFSDSAFTVLKALPKSYPYMPMFMISYQMGNILLYQGEYAEAIRYFNHFITYYQGESNVADGWYKMYLAALLLGQKGRADHYRTKGLAVEKLGTEADKNAMAQLKDAKEFDPALMKARLFCDGGYYRKALLFMAPLTDKSFGTIAQKGEFAYRKGRVFTGLKQQDSAAYYYQQALNITAHEPESFSANAALELGYIQMDRKNWGLARTYFEKAIDMPSHAYSEGIERKAKAALDEIKQRQKE